MEAKTFNMYCEDLEVLREEKAQFPEYYNLMLEGIKDLSGNNLASFVYAVLNEVRNLGAEENTYKLKQRMIEKVNEL